MTTLEQHAKDLAWRLAQAEEEEIRNGLVLLGWIPPDVADEARRILVEALDSLLSLGADVADGISDARIDLAQLLGMQLKDERA